MGKTTKKKWRVVKITPTGETSSRFTTLAAAKQAARNWKDYRHTHGMKGRTRVVPIPKYAQY